LGESIKSIRVKGYLKDSPFFMKRARTIYGLFKLSFYNILLIKHDKLNPISGLYVTNGPGKAGTLTITAYHN